MANYVMVNTRDEALALIGSGRNPLDVRSPEAPHGYKADGTPAGKRGRPAGSGSKAKKVMKGRTVRGPLTKTDAAPYGVKADGTAMKKRGRPSKVEVAARTAEMFEAAKREAAAKEERKVARAAERADRAAQKAEATKQVEMQNAELVPLGLDQIVIGQTVVRRIYKEVVDPSKLNVRGTVQKVSETGWCNVLWSNGKQQYHFHMTLALAEDTSPVVIEPESSTPEVSEDTAETVAA